MLSGRIRAGCCGQDRPAGPDRRGPGHRAGRRLGPARPSRRWADPPGPEPVLGPCGRLCLRSSTQMLR